MKYLAHTEPDPKSPTVHILQVWHAIKQNPTAHRETYYSADHHLTPMHARFSEVRRPHFCFNKGATGDSSTHSGGEGPVHYLTKQIICRNRHLLLQNLYKGKLYVNRVDFDLIEEEFSFDGNRFRADIFATIKSSRDMRLRQGDRLAIEIRDTHAVDIYKKNFYRREGIRALELEVGHLNTLYDNDWKKGETMIHNWLQKGVKVKWINNPYVPTSHATVTKSAASRPLIPTPDAPSSSAHESSQTGAHSKTLLERLRNTIGRLIKS